MMKECMKKAQDDINERVNRGVSGQSLQDKEMRYDPSTGKRGPCDEVNMNPAEDESRGFDNDD